MRVRVVKNKYCDIPSYAKGLYGHTEAKIWLNIGDERQVYALSVYKGVPVFLILDENNYFSLKPNFLFEIIDPSIPSDWKVLSMHESFCLALGPEFMTVNYEAYEAAVEQHPEMYRKMIAYVRSLEKPAKDDIEN